MKERTSRQILLEWRAANITERRHLESELRTRSMPIRLPTEEAIVYALIDWLEDVEKRLAKRPAPRKRAKPKATTINRGVPVVTTKPIPLAVGGWSPDEAA